MTVGRQPAGIIELDGKPFVLAKNQQGQPEWHPRQIATQEGDPTRPGRFRWNDWSRGMGDSRGAFRGAVELAENAYTGASGRMLPGHKVTEVATNNDAPITAIVEVTAPATKLLVCGGRYVKEVDPVDDSIDATGDMGVGKVITDALLYIDVVAIALGNSVDFAYRDAAGTYATNTLSAKAFTFGLSTEGDLMRGRSYYWSKCTPANFYTVANWGTEYDIGDRSRNITKVFSHNRWDYVLKEEGLYSFDQSSSKESNILTDLIAWASSKNRRHFTWYDRLFLCTFAGLYRTVQQGGARTVGVEEQEMNESALADAYPTAGVGYGKWAYVAYYVPAATPAVNTGTTYICAVRNAKEGDASFGSPFTVVCIIDSFTAEACQAMHVSSATGVPILYYGAYNAGNYTLRHFQLTRDGRPASYRDSGTATITLSPTDFGSPFTTKYFRGFEVIARNVTGGIQFSARMDEGSYNDVGTLLTSVSGRFGQKFWTPGTNDSGRVMQGKIAMTLTSPTAPPEIRELVANYEERPTMVEGAIAVIDCRDGQQSGDVGLRISAYEQKQLIEGYLDGTVIQITDAYGATYRAAISNFEGDAAYQIEGQMPQDSIAVAIRRLDYS